jgi:hypothetical protein
MYFFSIFSKISDSVDDFIALLPVNLPDKEFPSHRIDLDTSG